jgi:hypothetical protein
MSDEQKIYDSKGKFLGTFRPSKGGSDSGGGGGCVGIIVAILIVIYLVVEGWSGIVKPTYHFAPADSAGTQLLVKSMTFEKGRFFDADQVEGHFLVSVSDYDTLFFTGTWDDELRLTMAEHDFKYNTFKSGEEVVVQWDSDGVTLENQNPLSDEYGQVERWEGGMDSVQWWMALILVVTALWILNKLFRG